jgi:hypothetical protein
VLKPSTLDLYYPKTESTETQHAIRVPSRNGTSPQDYFCISEASASDFLLKPHLMTTGNDGMSRFDVPTSHIGQQGETIPQYNFLTSIFSASLRPFSSSPPPPFFFPVSSLSLFSRFFSFLPLLFSFSLSLSFFFFFFFFFLIFLIFF